MPSLIVSGNLNRKQFGRCGDPLRVSLRDRPVPQQRWQIAPEQPQQAEKLAQTT
ncbi:MAG: hypothetical protein HC840_26355, partial [Leptolyngbyaceae cyanobacterium RM2_2_4]|nr:hypothetical protein [Leptolyngbyaceae cyanobacterium RM2_2_4]